MDLRMNSSGVLLDKGKLQLTSSRGESLAQRLTVRLKTHMRSWFIDKDYGVDYFGQIFEKTVEKVTIDTIFHSAILSDERVLNIVKFNSFIEENVYNLSFQVKARDGTISDLVNADVSRLGINIR